MSKHRLYIDESGDHSVRGVTAAQWDKRYICLLGCAIEIEHCRNTFNPSFESFKSQHFESDPDDPVILHREDLKAKRGHFRVLTDTTENLRFNQNLIAFVSSANIRLFAVVIDKLNCQGRHFGPITAHPYHIGLLTMLERYCGWLKFERHTGDCLAEARGGREDLQLKSAYASVHSAGTRFRPRGFFQATLTSKEIKIKPKTQNIPALQLADLLAYPAKRKILGDLGLAPSPTGFTLEMANVLEPKYNRRYLTGNSMGYGKIVI